MDYYQTTERYRKREAKSQLRFILRILALLVTLWVGWIIGQNQQWSVFSSSSDRLQELVQNNNRLEQTVAVLTEQLNTEQQRRLAAEALINTEDKDVVSLRKLVSRYLAKDVPPEQIRQLLNSLGEATKCRKIEQRDVEVVTPNFAGGNSDRMFLSETLSLFIEGEAGQDANHDNPWFDLKQPITVRASFLGGEKITIGVLPLTMVLAMEDWLIRIRLTDTDLNGYANVTISKCLIN